MKFWNADILVLKNVINAKAKFSTEIVIGNAEKSIHAIMNVQTKHAANHALHAIKNAQYHALIQNVQKAVGIHASNARKNASISAITVSAQNYVMKYVIENLAINRARNP